MIVRNYKFIQIDETTDTEYTVFNNKTNDCLAHINYYKPWKEWVIFPYLDCVFSADCLIDLAHFLNLLNTGKIKPEKTPKEYL